MAAPIKKHAALLLGCLATAAATQGVPKEVVESALVFDGSSAMGLKDNNDAAQCLRWAVVASLRDGYSQAFVSLPEATAYVKGGETDTKVSFTVSATGIEAVHVRDDLMSAAMEPSNPDYASEFMVALSNCSWPYDKIDQDASEHVLQSETYRHSSFADAGAIVSSAVVLEGFRAHNFNADEVAITQFGITVAAVLQAATVQIDNVVAEEYRPPSIQDDDDPAAPVANDDYDESLTTTVRFDVAIHYWPVNAVVLETPEAITLALKTSLANSGFQSTLAVYAGPQFCTSCVLRDATVNVDLSYKKIDELTMDGSHAVAAPIVPCTANCGSSDDDDEDGLDEGAAAAVAIFVILAVVGIAGLIFWLYRGNKLRECCPSEEVEASTSELELDKVSSSSTTEPQTGMV